MEKKEAMKILKDFHDKSALFSVRTALDTVIPELNESEDEAHIDSLLKRLEGICKPGAAFISTRFAISEDADWLKSLKGRVQPKQGWSEDDEKERKRVVGLLEGWMSTFKETCYAEDCKRGIEWLNSLIPQPKQEWSKEDRKIIIELIGIFESAVDGGNVTFPYRLVKDYIRVLKSLKG